MTGAQEVVEPDPIDLRLVPAAVALWCGALAGVSVSVGTGLLLCGASGLPSVALRRRLSASGRRVLAAATICLTAGFMIGAARAAPVRAGPVTDLAVARAYVEVQGVVTRDPTVQGAATAGSANGDPESGNGYVVARIRVERITGRGETYQVGVPVLLVSSETQWASLLPGQPVRVGGRLELPDEPDTDVAAVFRPVGPPETMGPPGVGSRLTEPFRAGLRGSVADGPRDARGLVPALVVGDESQMTDDLRSAMGASGLAHLTAVSGTNVTIILVVVLAVARLLGARAYALPVLGALCIAGFVLLARPDPSVLRAGAMGAVAVVGLTVAGRRRGVPSLATAVCVLILVDPWLSRSVGFVLSVLATAGILALVPVWQRALWWLPRTLAAAVAVPLAAQVACTPVVLAVSGELSLASLPANMLAAPAVAPATVLGVAAAVVGPLVPAVAAFFGWLAALPAWWIAAVARWFADQPGAVLSWPSGAGGVVVALLLAVIAVVAIPVVLRRPVVAIAAAGILMTGLLKSVPTPGWPPPDWLVVACDVGQGDAIVLRAGPRAAVVVDAGPEPRDVRRCLDELSVARVPLLVLTHFHADHVAGLPGVLAGREVGRAIVSPLDEPLGNAALVRRWLSEAGIPVDVAAAGERRAVGANVQLEVVWPRRLIASPEESMSNNASVVLDAEVDGVDVLLAGDLEPTAQRALLRAEPELAADVLKVAHHGSSHQDFELLSGLGASVALVSVGDDNTYGHPSPRVVDALRDAGARVFRTDQDGMIVVVRNGDTFGVATDERR